MNAHSERAQCSEIRAERGAERIACLLALGGTPRLSARAPVAVTMPAKRPRVPVKARAGLPSCIATLSPAACLACGMPCRPACRACPHCVCRLTTHAHAPRPDRPRCRFFGAAPTCRGSGAAQSFSGFQNFDSAVRLQILQNKLEATRIGSEGREGVQAFQGNRKSTACREAL